MPDNVTKETHIQGNVQIRSDKDLLALEVGIGQIGHGLLAGRHGVVGVGEKMRGGGFWLISKDFIRIRDCSLIQKLPLYPRKVFI